MKIKRIANMQQHFLIQLESDKVEVQRRYADTAADDPMTYTENLVCALCEHIQSLSTENGGE